MPDQARTSFRELAPGSSEFGVKAKGPIFFALEQVLAPASNIAKVDTEKLLFIEIDREHTLELRKVARVTFKAVEVGFSDGQFDRQPFDVAREGHSDLTSGPQEILARFVGPGSLPDETSTIDPHVQPRNDREQARAPGVRNVNRIVEPPVDDRHIGEIRAEHLAVLYAIGGELRTQQEQVGHAHPMGPEVEQRAETGRVLARLLGLVGLL